MKVYQKIAGGTTFPMSLSKENMTIQSPEIHLACSTSGGEIGITLPSLLDYKYATSLKVYVDDVDDMAGTNPITLDINRVPQVENKKIMAITEHNKAFGIVIVIPENMRQIKVGSVMTITGFHGNDGEHLISNVTLSEDRVHANVFSKTLGDAKVVPSTALVALTTIIPYKIDNADTFVMNRDGQKVEIFISSENEFGVIDGSAPKDEYVLVGYMSSDDLNQADDKTINAAKPLGKVFDGLFVKTVEAFESASHASVSEMSVNLGLLENGLNVTGRKAMALALPDARSGITIQYAEAQDLLIAFSMSVPNPKDWTSGMFQVYALVRDFPKESL